VFVIIAMYAALWIMKRCGLEIPNMLSLSLITGLMDIIPYIGPIFSIIPLGGLALIYQGFVQKSGYARLPDLLRYLQAINKRMDKLTQDVNRDRAAMLRVEQVQQAYQQLLAKLPKSKPISDEVEEIRYMIEELRVSLFAQQLGTKYQVSDKRILNLISSI